MAINLPEVVSKAFSLNPAILSATQRSNLQEQASANPDCLLQAMFASALVDENGAIVAFASGGKINMNIQGTQEVSGALVNHFQVSIGSGDLISILGTNNGPDQFIQIWDANGKSDSQAKLLFPFPISAGKPFALDTALTATRGIYIRNSSVAVSTQAELAADTALGAADCWFTTRHI